jgi:hypothetical protein
VVMGFCYCSCQVFWVLFFCGDGNQIQGLKHARQTFYH